MRLRHLELMLPNLSALAPSPIRTDMQAADADHPAPMTWLQADELAKVMESTLRVMEDDSATEPHQTDLPRTQLLVSLCEQLKTLRLLMGSTPVPEALVAAYTELAKAMQVDPVETARRVVGQATDAHGIMRDVYEDLPSYLGRMYHLLKERCNFLSRVPIALAAAGKPWGQMDTKGKMILQYNYVGNAEDYQDPGLTVAEKVARCIWFCKRCRRFTTRAAAEAMMTAPWSTTPLALQTFPPPDRLYDNMNNEQVLFTHNHQEVQARVVAEDANHVLTVTWTDAHGVVQQATPARTAVRLAPTATATGLEHLLMASRRLTGAFNAMPAYYYAQIIIEGAKQNCPEGIDTVRRVHPYSFYGAFNVNAYLAAALNHAVLSHKSGAASRRLLTAIAHRDNMTPPDATMTLRTWVSADHFFNTMSNADEPGYFARMYYLFKPDTPNLFFWADETDAVLQEQRAYERNELTRYRAERAGNRCDRYYARGHPDVLNRIRTYVNVPQYPFSNSQAKTLLLRLRVDDPSKAPIPDADRAAYVQLVQTLYALVTDPADRAQLQGVVAAASATDLGALAISLPAPTGMQAADANEPSPITVLDEDHLADVLGSVLRLMEDESDTVEEATHNERRAHLVTLCQKIATLRGISQTTNASEATVGAFLELASILQIDPVETARRVVGQQADAQGVLRDVYEPIADYLKRVGLLLKERCNFVSRELEEADWPANWPHNMIGYAKCVIRNVGWFWVCPPMIGTIEALGLTPIEKLARAVWYCKRVGGEAIAQVAAEIIDPEYSGMFTTTPMTLHTFASLPLPRGDAARNQPVLFTHNHRQVQARVVKENANDVLTVTWTDEGGAPAQTDVHRDQVQRAPTATAPGLEHVLMVDRREETAWKMNLYEWGYLVQRATNANVPEAIDIVRRVRPYMLSKERLHSCLEEALGDKTGALVAAIAHRDHQEREWVGGQNVWMHQYVEASDFQRALNRLYHSRFESSAHVLAAYYPFEEGRPNLFYEEGASAARLAEYRATQRNALTAMRFDKLQFAFVFQTPHRVTHLLLLANVPGHPFSNAQAVTLLDALFSKRFASRRNNPPERAQYTRLAQALYAQVTDTTSRNRLRKMVPERAPSERYHSSYPSY